MTHLRRGEGFWYHTGVAAPFLREMLCGLHRAAWPGSQTARREAVQMSRKEHQVSKAAFENRL